MYSTALKSQSLLGRFEFQARLVTRSNQLAQFAFRRALPRAFAILYETDNLAHQLAFKQRRMTLIGDFDQFHLFTPRAHAGHRCCRKDVGICAANDQHRHIAECVELVPQRRHWKLDVDAGERTHDAKIVGRL